MNAPVEPIRVGTCMAWQWMCPHYCGYVLGINADLADITAKAAKHVAVCADVDREQATTPTTNPAAAATRAELTTEQED